MRLGVRINCKGGTGIYLLVTEHIMLWSFLGVLG